jgi:hypothetical protein
MALAGRIRDAEKERRKGGWGVGFGKTNARIFVLCLVSQIKIKKKLLEPWIKKNQNPTLSNSLNRSLRSTHTQGQLPTTHNPTQPVTIPTNPPTHTPPMTPPGGGIEHPAPRTEVALIFHVLVI